MDLTKHQTSMALNKYIEHINTQFHVFNELWILRDRKSNRYRIGYYNDEGSRVGLSRWLSSEDARKYLTNFIDMFCIDASNHERFFEIDDSTAIVPIDVLKPIRKRKKGIENARIYMREAYVGNRDKRAPLSVKRALKGRDYMYSIVDGNSTYHVALELGMKEIPIKTQ